MILIFYFALFIGTILTEKELFVTENGITKLIQLRNGTDGNSYPFVYEAIFLLLYAYIGIMALHYAQRSRRENHMKKLSFIFHLILISTAMGSACFMTFQYLKFL